MPPRGRPSREQRKLLEFQKEKALRLDSKSLLNELSSLRHEILHLTHQHKKVHNQMLLLRTATVKTLTFLFQLLDDPDAKDHARAVVNDYKWNANKMEDKDGN